MEYLKRTGQSIEDYRNADPRTQAEIEGRALGYAATIALEAAAAKGAGRLTPERTPDTDGPDYNEGNGPDEGVDQDVSQNANSQVSVDDIPGIGPTPGQGGFADWFNNLSAEEFAAYWGNTKTREKIQRLLRAPGGFHEWAMVSRADKFYSWGFTANDIWSFRTNIKNLTWINPNTGLPGRHGGHGSGAFHNELGRLIDNSKNIGELQSGLISLGHRWGIPNLPSLIRR